MKRKLSPIRGTDKDGTKFYRKRQSPMATDKHTDATQDATQAIQATLFDDVIVDADGEPVPIGFVSGKPLWKLHAYYKAQKEYNEKMKNYKTKMPNWEVDDGKE